MRRIVAIAGLMAALSFGSAPALAFQETAAPPPADIPQAAPPAANAPALELGSPGAAANPQADRKGVNVFGYNLFPKLDFGLDVLYGQDQQQLELQGPTTLEENGDVTVLGKVKRRF
jgi:hypothetical protein